LFLKAKEKNGDQTMPRSKHLKIIVGVEGTCAIDAINVTGPSCLSATQEIANA
jgi:hypothetical protein